jgi:prepilin-type N-terminal cleavage/methylation domain-containing protein
MNFVKNKRTQNGFTLIEMALVIVIIGVILGGISVAKNLQRDAEKQKIYQKFVGQWKQLYDQYYQRTGVVVGDSQVAPSYMINGSEAVLNNTSGSLPGIPSSYTSTGLRICHGQGYVANSVGAGDGALATQDLYDLVDRIGLRMPPGRAEGQEDRYVYLDSNGNPVELQVCFQWNPEKTNSGAGNVMVLRGLTPDLARTLDQLIDGKPDSIEGRFRQQDVSLNSNATTSQVPGQEWQANNTYEQGGTGVTSAIGDGDNKDENRIVLLTAHWIMDQ